MISNSPMNSTPGPNPYRPPDSHPKASNQTKQSDSPDGFDSIETASFALGSIAWLVWLIATSMFTNNYWYRTSQTATAMFCFVLVLGIFGVLLAVRSWYEGRKSAKFLFGINAAALTSASVPLFFVVDIVGPAILE
ncbi:membrane protein [Rhodopirellula europaea 6C]|uniref:Membrane protein n=1 Tax=Rhodopirellula europaea 6C TaxID=1263867 RepID=M2AF35_9BACT|nr:membrane protein [Rhodopirellula europaea 6C]